MATNVEKDGTMDVFIENDGNSFPLFLGPTFTTQDVKADIHNKLGMPIHEQELIMDNKILGNDKNLGELRVRRCKTLHFS